MHNPSQHTHLDPTFSGLRDWIDDRRPTSIAVVMDSETERHCLPILAPHLPPGSQFLSLSGHGEDMKSLEHVHALWDSLEGMGMDRRGLIVALGGGTVTDLTAFAASTYFRGTALWMVPTTVLAMVDAAIGGKTGINFRGLKNRIGTFYSPEGISIHTEMLHTLSPRDWRNGWTEHIKHLLLKDSDLPEVGKESRLHRLLTNTAPREEVASAILESVQIKSDVVNEDPTESKGRRRVLNLGHTVGHAIESWSMEHDKGIKHGEAVAFGLRVCLAMSKGHLSCPSAKGMNDAAISSFLDDHFGLDCAPPSAEMLWSLMATDKKNAGGEVQVILLDGPGRPVEDVTLTYKEFAGAYEQITTL